MAPISFTEKVALAAKHSFGLTIGEAQQKAEQLYGPDALCEYFIPGEGLVCCTLTLHAQGAFFSSPSWHETFELAEKVQQKTLTLE